MNQKIVLSFVGIMLIVCSNELLAQGAVIEVSLKDGRNFEGELVSVRESTLVIYTVELKADEISAVQVKKYEVVPRALITRVTIPTTVKDTSKSGLRVLKGFLIGAAAGALAIALFNIDNSHESGNPFSHISGNPGPILIVVGGLLGVGSEFLVGGSQSSEMIINNPAIEYFSWLKSLARFPQDEPEYLQNVK